MPVIRTVMVDIFSTTVEEFTKIYQDHAMYFLSFSSKRAIIPVSYGDMYTFLARAVENNGCFLYFEVEENS